MLTTTCKIAIAAALSAAALAATAQSAAATGAASPQADGAAPVQGAAPSGRDVVKAAYQRADANGDGKLTREEAASLPAVAQGFDKLDKNGDGVLDSSEFETGVTAGEPAK